jgi:hypothetical protein
MNHTVEYMKKNGVPITRANYLDYAYLGNPPAQLSAEEEAELPEELQRTEPEEKEEKEEKEELTEKPETDTIPVADYSSPEYFQKSIANT